MSEDSRAGRPKRKGPVLLNPSAPDDDRKEHSNHPTSTARPPVNSSPRNPTYPNGSISSNRQNKQNTPQLVLLSTDPAVATNRYQPPPASSSRVSTSSTSTPPTPSLLPPSASVELDSPSIAVQITEAGSYADRTYYDFQPPQTSAPRRPSKGYQYTKPFSGLPIGKLDGPRRPRTSRTQDLSYGAAAPPSTADTVTIFVSADAERYVTVDLTGIKTAAQIWELILTKLHIYNEDDKIPYLIYHTEVGAYAIGDALTDNHLLTLCRDHSDAKGTLKFLVIHSYTPVHEPPPP